MKIIFQIVDRLKNLRGYKTDGEVAAALKTTKTALSNHKARNTVPYEAIVSFCEIENISLDWLLTGKEPEKPQKTLLTEQEQRHLKVFRELSLDGKILIAAEVVKRKEQEQQRGLRKKASAVPEGSGSLGGRNAGQGNI